MADLQITQLQEIGSGGLQAADPIALADVSASETKKITAKNFVQGAIALVDTASIPATKLSYPLSAGQIVTATLADNAVTNAKLENSSISLGGVTLTLGSTDATPAIDLTDAVNYPTSSLSGTITNAQLAGSIANNKLSNSSVSFGGISLSLGGTDATPAFNLTDATGYQTSNLAGTITNDQLAGSIANSKLASSTISLGGVSIALGATDSTPAFNLSDATGYPTSALIGTITNDQLAGNISGGKIHDASIGEAKLSLTDGSISGAKISGDSITAVQLASDSVTASELADNSVDTTAVVNNAITGAKIAPNTIDDSNIAANAIGSSELADSSVDANAIQSSAVTTAKINNLAVTNAKLAGSITGDKLSDTTVTFAKLNLSDGDIPGAKITADSITATQIGLNAIGASELADNSVDTAAIVDNAVTNAKLASSSITLGGVSISLGSTDSTPAFDLQDATGLPTTSLTGTITNAQLAGSIANSKLTNTSVNFGGVSVALGASDSTPAFDLTDAINYPASSLTGTITNAQLAGSIDVSKLVSSSVSLGGVSVTLGTADATPAFDLQDATGYSTSALVGTITNAQLAGSITATKLATNSITSTQLGENCVTASELSDNAVDTAAILDTAVTDSKISSVSGIKITDGTITAAKLNTSNLDRSLNVASGNLGINNAVTGGASVRNGITYNNQGLITATTALVASDLPEATTSAIGAVSVPSSGGLAVTNLGALSINNTITGTTRSGITFNNQGLITASAALQGSDLPVATTTVKGAVVIPTGSAPLAVDSNGVLSIADSGVTAGTHTKVTVSAKGIITGSSTLAASDIPNLTTSKITTGTFGTDFLANDSITMDKLANLSTGFIQEGSPDISNLPTGVFWLQESTGQLRIFNGNSFFSVGFGRLSEENLRFCGTFNASNGTIVTLTAFGTSAGFTVGNAIPAGTNTLTGAYFVCVTPGNGTAVVPSTSFDAGDWCLCVGADDWDRIDTLSGPGSVSSLNDLSDVTINSPVEGNLLQYSAAGQFANVQVIAAGTF